MIIAGTSFPIQPWPTIRTIPKIDWSSDKLATGFYSGRDFGANKDIYEGSVLITDSLSVINSLQLVLNANRNGITLSGFNSAEIIFGANVDYSGSINATVKNFGNRKNLYNDVLFDLEIGFRAISPVLLTTTPSLATLNLQEKWEGDKSADITKLFSYNQTPSYIDHKTDAGLFKGAFIQTTEQMKAIRAYLLTVARANPITFPKLFSTTFYPFGANSAESAFQKCHVLEWSDKLIALDWWELQITFAQAMPYFSAGLTSEPDKNLATPSDTPVYYATPGDL